VGFGTAESLFLRCLNKMDEIEKTKNLIEKFWKGKFTFKREIPLKELFSEPKDKDLKHIWKYGHADLAVFRNGKLIAIFEPGGFHHLKDKRQIQNDILKYKLCKLNKVSCCHFANATLERLKSNREKRKFLGAYLFRKF
jgi:hypothetical protein